MGRSALAIVIAVMALLGGCLSPVEPAPSAVRDSVESQLGAAGLSYLRAAASPDFMRHVALSGSGAPDWIVDFNEARGSYCGTAGCPLQVWVKSAGDAWRVAFDQKVLGWRLETAQGGQLLQVRLHGALCGRTALEDCVQAFRWTGGAGAAGGFAPVTDARPGPLVQPIRLNPDEAPTPVRYAVKAYEAACTRAGGVPETDQSVHALPDLNGDQSREMLFDASIAWCWNRDRLAPVRPDCKAGSCNSRIFSRTPAGWREVLAAPKLRYEIDYRDDGAVMKVDGRPLRWAS